jgi:hypothetical protein
MRAGPMVANMLFNKFKRPSGGSCPMQSEKRYFAYCSNHIGVAVSGFSGKSNPPN